MQTFKTFFEKTVIGLIERINIAGIGDIDAKIDSGNGAFNVLAASDISVQGNKVNFTTVGGKRLQKDIHDTITINVGAGHVEERPVVLFRIKFGSQEFDNIPFSLGNRDNNEHKVLVGKEFINQLNALIDINSTHIAGDAIDIDYKD